MVNVAGRSKACLTCRARKIRCDLTLPKCNNCTHNGHVCRGYERPRVFVNYASATANTNQELITLPVVSGKTAAKKWRVYVSGDSRPHIMAADGDTRIVASPDSRPSERSQFHARFLDSFCPDDFELLGPSERSAHFWIRDVFTLYSQSGLLDAAFSTLATTYIGQSRRSVQLQQQSAKLYDKSLRDLGQIMGGNKAASDTHVLASIMCLGFAEVFSPLQNQEHGWIAHNKGACELIMSRGSTLLQSPLGRNIFLRFRITGIYAAIGRREAFPLAGREFTQLSRLANANYFDYLVEEMMAIPQLLKDMRELAAEAVESVMHSKAKSLLSRATAVIESFLGWFTDFRLKHYMHPCVWLESSKDNNNNHNGRGPGSSIYPNQLEFPNLLVAQAMMHYWASLIILLRCLLFSGLVVGGDVAASLPLELRQQCNDYLGIPPVKSESENLTDRGDPPPGSAGELQVNDILFQLADAIACSVGYCTSEKKGAAGLIILLFPLWVAKDLHANSIDTLSLRKNEYFLGVFRGLMDRGLKFSQPLRNHSPPI